MADDWITPKPTHWKTAITTSPTAPTATESTPEDSVNCYDALSEFHTPQTGPLHQTTSPQELGISEGVPNRRTPSVTEGTPAKDTAPPSNVLDTPTPQPTVSTTCLEDYHMQPLQSYSPLLAPSLQEIDRDSLQPTTDPTPTADTDRTTSTNYNTISANLALNTTPSTNLALMPTTTPSTKPTTASQARIEL